MVAIATFIPGASYASSTFTLSWTAINTALTALGYSTVTATDSSERLLWALLTVMYGKSNPLTGTLTAPSCGAEVNTASITTNSVWEVTSGSFPSTDVVSMIAAFRLSSLGAANQGNNIANV